MDRLDMSSDDSDSVGRPDYLGHFNMELFYFSEILDSFGTSNQIDQTSVKYLTKIVKQIDNVLHRGRLEKVYESEPLVSEDFDNVTLMRNFHCHSCNGYIPFLWTDFQQHLDVCVPGAVGGDVKKEVQEKKPIASSSKTSGKEEVNLQSLAAYHENLINGVEKSSAKKSLVDSAVQKALVKKELERQQKELKRTRKKEKKDLKKVNFELKKKTIVLLKMVQENINQSVAIGEKIINLQSYKEIIADLENSLKGVYPEVKVYVFGSRKTGLGSLSGDLDLFVDVNNHYNKPLKSKEETVEIIEKVMELLSRDNSNWGKMIPIVNARTPILKANNMIHRIPCDLSFTNGLSHINTSLIRYLLTLQPDCHRVACFVKTWYKTVFTGRAEVNKLSSYMITLLVVFYMQTISRLPAIYDLQDTVEKPLMIGDWQGDFRKPTLAELNFPESNNAKKILIEFFNFYHNFDFETYVICPLLGHPIERKLFETPELLPDKMMRYKQFVQKLPPGPESAKELLATDTVMCVQDPLELCHNVAKGIHFDLFAKFTILCEKSRNVLLMSES